MGKDDALMHATLEWNRRGRIPRAERIVNDLVCPNGWRQARWYAFALVTPVSRMYHDQHWLSDVLLSTAIGTTLGMRLVYDHRQRNLGGIHVQ
jgi:hypothetical protein